LSLSLSGSVPVSPPASYTPIHTERRAASQLSFCSSLSLSLSFSLHLSLSIPPSLSFSLSLSIPLSSSLSLCSYLVICLGVCCELFSLCVFPCGQTCTLSGRVLLYVFQAQPTHTHTHTHAVISRDAPVTSP